jgi:predicted nucleic acid-binding protein
VEIMAVFQLDSYDAIHAATALATGATELATFDSDFLKLTSVPSMDIQVIRD